MVPGHDAKKKKNLDENIIHQLQLCCKERNPDTPINILGEA